MLYDRKIKYLDYYEGGTKVNGGGFAKLEVRDNTLRIELTVRGLHPTDSFERDIVLQGSEKEGTLGQIRIQNGCGQFRYSCNADQEMGATGISYSGLRGIRISIGGTREILCRWDNVSDKRRITPPEESTQKSNPSLQESKREAIADSYTGNKADSEASVYTENERLHELRLRKSEKAEEKRKEVEKEECESIEDKDREEKNREDRDKDRQEEKSGEDRDRDRQEEKSGEDRDRERQEDKNKEGKEAANTEIEKKECRASDNEGLETKGKGMKPDARPEPTEMQAQEATMFSDAMSPKLSEEPLQTGSRMEERSGGRVKDKPDMDENNRAEQSAMNKAPVKLMEDKWQQLSAIYPHIQPFRDERDYLSLTPSDFVLFPDRFYRAVNNSFLLHGYYNYHHLILARIERRGEFLYYIGVPGNYFEREKQVAIMFGFESFECETEPAKTGDFGYYMMRTEL